MLVLHHEDLPHPVRRIDLVEGVVQPDARHRAQSVSLEDRLDVVPQVGLAVDGDRLPGVEEDLEERLLRGGADAERDLFQQDRFEVVPGPHEVVDEDRLPRHVHVDRPVGVHRTDLDHRRDLARQELEEIEQQRTKPFVARRDLERIGVGFLALARHEVHEVPLERWRCVEPLDTEREGVPVQHHALKIRSKLEVPHRFHCIGGPTPTACDTRREIAVYSDPQVRPRRRGRLDHGDPTA